MEDNWFGRLKQRWNIPNTWETVLVLLIFACTGTTVFLIKKPLLRFFMGNESAVWASVLYYILILPIYNLLLLCYGFIFGRFEFFWNFEKRFFKRIFSYFTS